ncbi:MAG: hypothetical protein E7317_11570 [Clostridiales bacterium]|nr:hypothetical protein [Clostridiales bacterium]
MVINMKHIWVRSILCLMLVAMLPSVALAQTGIINEDTKVYQKASTSSKSLKVKAGTEVEVIATKDDWAMVERAGIQAFIPTRYLMDMTGTDAPETNLAAGVTATVSKDTRAYKKPKTSAKSIAVKSGTTVTVKAIQDPWALVERGGVQAYMLVSDLVPPSQSDTPTEEMLDYASLMQNAQSARITQDARVYQSASTSAKSVKVREGLKVNLLATQDGWSLIERNGIYAYIASDLVRVIQSAYNKSGAIVDISQWDGAIDYAKLKASASLVIVRATHSTIVDYKFDTYARQLNAYDIPFGVYCYSHADTVDEAKKEALKLYETAKGYSPKFYVMDAETPELSATTIRAFAQALRALGAKRVGCYVAHHYYQTYRYSTVKDAYDFTWIPSYGKDDGTLLNARSPSYECDLWQYTSKGTISGISGKVDLNVVTGKGKSLAWFQGEE